MRGARVRGSGEESGGGEVDEEVGGGVVEDGAVVEGWAGGVLVVGSLVWREGQGEGRLTMQTANLA